MESFDRIKIERNIPIPMVSRKYPPMPLGEMGVGDSFLLKGPNVKSIRVTIANFSRKHIGWKFLTRTVKAEGGVRVWRVS